MQNKVEIIYCCNHEWLETSVRTFAEVFIIIFFLLFLIVMIKTVPNQGTNTSIVGLGCGLFIGLMYLNTFFLKCFRQMEISLVSLTLCMDALRG
jgi:TRAP-type C4-dicarboxylate transport system permease small subunit